MSGLSVLSQIELFRAMEADDLRLLEQGSRSFEPQHGMQIFAQGDPADSVYAIVAGDGRVRIEAADQRGKVLMVEVFKTGDIFGEIGVLDGGTRSATAVTEGRLRLVYISGVSFRGALHRSPALGVALCQALSQRLRRTFQLLQDASFEELQLRLARQILYLVMRDSRRDTTGQRLARRLRQGDLADLLGATTRSIITILNNWRANGIVAYDTEKALLTVTDLPALEAIVRGKP